MHHKYHTDSVLLDVTPRGEADMYMTFYTKDLGLIRAQARGVRYLKSKLRFTLQPHACPHISLIRGKGMWQLTSAQVDDKNFVTVKTQTRRLFTRISKLLKRFIQGEERNDSLYHVLYSSHNFLNQREYNEDELQNLEKIIVLRILHSLGYISGQKDLHFCTRTDHIDENLILEMEENKKRALEEINRALKASHL